MLGLPPDRLLPPDAQPDEIAVNGGLELRAAAGQIDIFDPQQETSAEPVCKIRIEQSRVGMSKM
jgi:hypothetical protein